MQILPSTGRRYAPRVGVRSFSTARLTDPEVNVRIGTAYFADLVQQFNDVIASKSDVRVTDEVYGALGAANVVRRYQSAGAAGGKPFEEQLSAWKERLGL